MIVDKAKIFIKAGDGGNGCVSFHREKYVNAGGPDGGDGGDGGSVIFEASEDVRTLVDFRYVRKYAAAPGEQGRKKNMRGATGADIVIKVPPGTVVIDEQTGRVAADIRRGERRVLLRGGRGGKGNARFATPTRRAPRFATPGRKTEGRSVILELRSIADVGLVGFPNVGKSTLLSMVSAARPKIANYHFTTLSPNLGVVKQDGYSFVMADIPGIIEGAAQGAGLGHEFLRHIERTRMLVHVVDASGSEGRDPLADYEAIRAELREYGAELTGRPEIVAANKLDIDDSHFEELKAALEPRGVAVYPMSAATREGVDELMRAVAALLRTLPEAEPIEEDNVIEQWHMQESLTFDVTRGMDGIVEANGSLIDDLFERIDPEDPDSMRHFQKLLVDMGVIDALRDFGVKDGDEVRLGGETFDFAE